MRISDWSSDVCSSDLDKTHSSLLRDPRSMIPARSLCPNQNRQMALFAHIATPTETQLDFSQDAISHCLETAFLYLRELAGRLFPAFSFQRLEQCADIQDHTPDWKSTRLKSSH